MGDGTLTDHATPMMIGKGFTAVSARYHHVMALKADGSLWAWGWNASGQLGDGTTINRSTPVLIGYGYSDVASGMMFTMALKYDGSLWAWGGNGAGQLGDGTTTSRSTPVLIGYGYSAVAAGYDNAAALGTGGSLWAWGANLYGQLGDGTTTGSSRPVMIGSGYKAVESGYGHTLGLKDDGGLWMWGWSGVGTAGISSGPVLIGSGYRTLQSGMYHTIALKSDGSLWAWGVNVFGQLGDGTFTDRVTPVLIGAGYSAVAVGRTHTLAVKFDGSLWAWGGNYYGQLGDGNVAADVGTTIPSQVPGMNLGVPSEMTTVTGLWWNPAESGWGINFNQQANVLFASLFTYDLAGRPLWLVMSHGVRQADSNTFVGDLYLTTGSAFNAQPFNPITSSNMTKVGTLSVAYSSANAATLNYSVNGAAVTKTIQPLVFGSRAAQCQLTASARTALTNYQDLWWNPAESGWGVNVTHQDNTLFATLFTYDATGKGLWLVMSAGVRQTDGSYLGDLYQTTGSAFNAQPFTPITSASIDKVGTMQFRFTDGISGTLAYTVNGIYVFKAINRQEFSTPLPACSS